MGKSDLARQLWLAMVLLTRLPLPQLPQGAFAHGARAVWAYPLVGIVIGGAGGAAGWCALTLGLPPAVAALVTLAAMMVLTCALHEDGLADVCDGFWGGFDPIRRLSIMRDSQIGTYGVLALVVVTALRWSALTLLLIGAPAAVIVGASVSRAMMPILMARLPHARDDGLSRSVGRPTTAQAALALAIGFGLAVGLSGFSGIVAFVIATGCALGVGLLARAKIGGQTGDVLGATQQICEAAVLLTLLALL